MASNKEGLVPPTECPWKYRFEKYLILSSIFLSHIFLLKNLNGLSVANFSAILIPNSVFL